MTAAVPPPALEGAALTLARRFHRGATLWCWSPGWPPHAEHVAVEFVHPVIVGKRALSAIALGADNPADYLRHAGRPGDVLLAIGTIHDPGVVDLLARTPAWGVDAIWLTHGERPPVAISGHVVHLGQNPAHADVVCAYHLLWELTHVCFERPGLLDEADVELSCPACADAGDLGEVEAVDSRADAIVIVAGARRSVDLSLVGACEPGDLVVVHAGVAISKRVGARSG